MLQCSTTPFHKSNVALHLEMGVTYTYHSRILTWKKLRLRLNATRL